MSIAFWGATSALYFYWAAQLSNPFAISILCFWGGISTILTLFEIARKTSERDDYKLDMGAKRKNLGKQ